jgi:hypothetical protein
LRRDLVVPCRPEVRITQISIRPVKAIGREESFLEYDLCSNFSVSVHRYDFDVL